MGGGERTTPPAGKPVELPHTDVEIDLGNRVVHLTQRPRFALQPVTMSVSLDLIHLLGAQALVAQHQAAQQAAGVGIVRPT